MERIKLFGKSIEELAALQAKVAELSRKEDFILHLMESSLIAMMIFSVVTLVFYF